MPKGRSPYLKSEGETADAERLLSVKPNESTRFTATFTISVVRIELL
jgi:hypothetical protein